MAKKLGQKLLARGRKAAGRAYQKIETRILAAEGRKAVKAKAKNVKRVSRKAVKAGLLVGAATAVGVVVREVRRQRNRD